MKLIRAKYYLAHIHHLAADVPMCLLASGSGQGSLLRSRRIRRRENGFKTKLQIYVDQSIMSIDSLSVCIIF